MAQHNIYKVTCAHAYAVVQMQGGKGRPVSGSAWLLLSFITFSKVELNKVTEVALVSFITFQVELYKVTEVALDRCMRGSFFPTAFLEE